MAKALPKTVGTQLQHTSITERVVALGQSVTLVPPSSVEEAKNTAISAEANALLQHVQAGICYQYLKAELPHGEYEVFLKKIDVTPRRANERTSVANLFQKLTKPNRRTSADLETDNSNVRTCGHLENEPDQLELQNVPFSKMLALSKLNEQQLEQMPTTEINTLLQLPTRALNSEVKQLNLALDEQGSVQAENHRLKQQLEQTELDRAEAINMLNHEQNSKSPALKYGVSQTVAHTRERALVLHDLLSQCVGEVSHEIKKCTQSGLDVEQSKDCALALYYSLSAPIIHLAKKLEQLVNSYGVDVLQAPENMPVFSDEELEIAFKHADTIRGAIFVNRKA
ncbi:MAG: hypothetical protein JKY26_01505 [Pseudomonas sp.]|nr:hypothetical protein [Pseudomonas sp.]